MKTNELKDIYIFLYVHGCLVFFQMVINHTANITLLAILHGTFSNRKTKRRALNTATYLILTHLLHADCVRFSNGL